MSHIFALLIGIITSAFVVGASPRDAKVTLADLPSAAVNAVKERFPGAEIRDKVEKETESDGVFYEFELLKDGREIEVEVSAEGRIREIEAELTAADLPKAVAAAIGEKFPGGQVKKAKEEIKFQGEQERKVYEVDVLVDGKKLEVKLDPDGKILDID